jgi:hypothetical protein
MRDLINLLLESVGLANRKPGDLWQNDQGDGIVFQSLTFYPESGAFNSAQEMESALLTTMAELKIPQEVSLLWTNQSRGALAFAVAHFKDASTKKDYYIGRYFRSISPNRTENNFPNDLPGGFKLQTKTAKKERAGYKPTDVLTKLVDLTPNEIVEQIQVKFGINSDEARAIQMFVDGNPKDPIPLGNMNYEAFTNYFAEMLQPMALVLGKPVKGNAQEAESKFLGNQGFSSCTISFGGSKIGGLTDSTLTAPDGRSLGISTKAKAGAKASAKNLDDKVKEMANNEDGRRLLETYKEEVAILSMIVDGGYVDGPLNLAVNYRIITPEEKSQVRSLRKLGPQEIIGQGLLSKKLEKMYMARKAADPSTVIPFYHMLAAIAYPVADYINENTNFGKAASTILNFGAFMQAYTNATRQGDSIVLNEFTYDYPSTAVTNVLLSAHKTYYSTGNKGNFTFKILKNDATESEAGLTDDSDVEPDPDSEPAPNVVTGKRVDIRPPSAPRIKRNQDLGRERR